MYEEDRLLAEQCDRLSRETVAASEWLSHNTELVGRDFAGHEKELRKAGFSKAWYQKLTSGIVCLHVGEKAR